jgi:hypothetical protein
MLLRGCACCREEHKQAYEEWIATQFLFDRQWLALRVSKGGNMQQQQQQQQQHSCGMCVYLNHAAVLPAPH